MDLKNSRQAFLAGLFGLLLLCSPASAQTKDETIIENLVATTSEQNEKLKLDALQKLTRYVQHGTNKASIDKAFRACCVDPSVKVRSAAIRGLRYCWSELVDNGEALLGCIKSQEGQLQRHAYESLIVLALLEPSLDSSMITATKLLAAAGQGPTMQLMAYEERLGARRLAYVSELGKEASSQQTKALYQCLDRWRGDSLGLDQVVMDLIDGSGLKDWVLVSQLQGLCKNKALRSTNVANLKSRLKALGKPLSRKMEKTLKPNDKPEVERKRSFERAVYLEIAKSSLPEGGRVSSELIKTYKDQKKLPIEVVETLGFLAQSDSKAGKELAKWLKQKKDETSARYALFGLSLAHEGPGINSARNELMRVLKGKRVFKGLSEPERADVCQALGAIGITEKDAPLLMNELKDPKASANRKVGAFYALSTLKEFPKEAYDAIAFVKARDQDTRRSLIYALERLPSKRSNDLLVTLLKDVNVAATKSRILALLSQRLIDMEGTERESEAITLRTEVRPYIVKLLGRMSQSPNYYHYLREPVIFKPFKNDLSATLETKITVTGSLTKVLKVEDALRLLRAIKLPESELPMTRVKALSESHSYKLRLEARLLLKSLEENTDEDED